MEDLCEALLTSAAGPEDQHGYVGGRNHHRKAHDSVHLVARVDQAGEIRPAGELLSIASAAGQEPTGLLLLGAAREQRADGAEETYVIPGLGDVVGGAVLDELHGGLE